MYGTDVIITDNFLTDGEYKKHYVDLYDDEAIKLTYSIKDIRDISKRNTTYSKTITIPGTAENHKLFTNIFEINNVTDFNPSKKANCFVTVDTITVMEGSLQLTNIIINDESKVEYECVVYGQLVDVYKNIGDKLITGNEDSADDLDVSEYNHTLTYANITGSWSGNADTVGYFYPIIDFGSGFTATTLNTSNKLIPFTNFYPAVYVKPLVKKIINKAGFTYTSDFLDNNALYKKLFLPVVPTINPTEHVVATSSASLSVNTSYTFDFDTEVTDVHSEFSSFTSVPTPPPSNKPARFPYTTHVFTPAASGLFIIRLTLTGYVAGGEISFDLYEAGNNSAKTGTGIRIGSTATLGDSTNPTILTTSANLTAGTRYNVYYTPTKTSVTSVIDAGAKLEISGADSVDMNYCLPVDFKQSDLLTAICKLFNLYIEPDKDNAKNLIIEPRDAYYASGVVKDWSAKIDKNSGYDFSILSELTSKKFRFSYTEDSDKLNDSYKTIRNEIYGEHEVEIDNDFTEGETVVQSIFSPTPIEKVQGYNYFCIPKIYKQGENGKTEATDFKPRILVNFGEYTIENSGTITVNLGTDNVSTTYPFSGMYEIPEITGASTENAQSILFGNIQPINGSENGDLVHNLFNDFYSDEISSISSPDAKLLKAKFMLTPLDIYKFRFNDKIFLTIENSPAYFRVNRIIDFDAVTPTLTTVELIKIDEIYLTPIVTKTRGKYIPDTKTGTDATDNIKLPDVVISGKGNHVFSGGTIVVGGDNVIGSGSEGTTVIGKNNDIGSGNTHIHVIGESNFIDGGTITATVHGSGNIIGANGEGIHVVGDTNVIADSVVNVTVKGANNLLPTSAAHVEIFGNDNIVNAGITGVSIFGNSKIAAVSNSAYYDNIVAAGSISMGGSPLGTMALQNANAVAITGGTIAVTSATVGGSSVLTAALVGSMAYQNANAVAITGGTINGTTIGATTPSTIKATTVNVGNSTATSVLAVKGTGITSATSAFSVSNSANTQLLTVNDAGVVLINTLTNTLSNSFVVNGSSYFSNTVNIGGTTIIGAGSDLLLHAGRAGVTTIRFVSTTNSDSTTVAISALSGGATYNGLFLTTNGSTTLGTVMSINRASSVLIGTAASVDNLLIYTQKNNSKIIFGVNSIERFRLEDNGNAIFKCFLQNNFTMSGDVTDVKLFSLSYSSAFTATNTYGIYIADLVSGTQTNLPYSIYSVGATTRMYHEGRVNIGGNGFLTTAKLSAEGTDSHTYGIAGQISNTAAVTVTNYAGWFTNALSSGTGGNGGSTVTGLFGRARKGAGANSALNITLVGVEGTAVTSSAGTNAINTAIGGKFSVVADSTGNITTAKVLDISVSNTANFTNTYGIYINDLAAGTQTNLPYSIYSAGATTRMYHAGRAQFISAVRIGATDYVPSGTTMFSITTGVSNAIDVRNSSGTNTFLIDNAGTAQFNGASATTTIVIGTDSTYGSNNIYSTGGIKIHASGSSNTALTVGTSTIAYTVSSGAVKKMFLISQDVTLSSASSKVITYAEIAGTINQTAGVATGISYGLRVNNTLTAAYDYRAIQIDNDSHYAIFQSGANAKNHLNGSLLIGTTTNTNNSKVVVSGTVEITGTSSAFIPPKLTTTQRNALTGITGMVIYNTDTNTLDTYTGSGWAAVNGCCLEHKQLAISGTQDSSNVSFTIPQPVNPNTNQLYKNGALLIDGSVDYTLSGVNITFIVPPSAADKLVFFGTV